jgi:hypothetical protein
LVETVPSFPLRSLVNIYVICIDIPLNRGGDTYSVKVYLYGYDYTKMSFV